MTLDEARDAILTGNLRDHMGRKPVAIGRSAERPVSDCWLMFTKPDEAREPSPMSFRGIAEYFVRT